MEFSAQNRRSRQGQYFLPIILAISQAFIEFPWLNLRLLTANKANFCQEQEALTPTLEPFKSPFQGTPGRAPWCLSLVRRPPQHQKKGIEYLRPTLYPVKAVRTGKDELPVGLPPGMPLASMCCPLVGETAS